MKNVNPFNVQTGGIWEEAAVGRFDPPGRGKVLNAGKEYAAIITVGAGYKTRPRKAKSPGFDGKSHNYRLVRRANKSKDRSND
jgi:hypothetical protein